MARPETSSAVKAGASMPTVAWGGAVEGAAAVVVSGLPEPPVPVPHPAMLKGEDDTQVNPLHHYAPLL